MENDASDTRRLHLTALAVGYVRLVSEASESDPHLFTGRLLRLLAPLYVSMLELKPYGEDEGGEDYDSYDTGAILPCVTEEQYAAVAGALATLFGQYDTYLDITVQELRYDETPVAVSLSEQLSDIYQSLADFATTVADAPSEAVPDILADLKYRFHEYLADSLCAAMKTANLIYQSKTLVSE